MKTTFRVYFKDVDPDTGQTSQIKLMCECSEAALADCISAALAQADPEPNREYWVAGHERKTATLVVIVDSTQLEIARTFQQWCAAQGVTCIVCFGKEDSDSIRGAFDRLGIKYMLAILGQSPELEQIEGWELKMSSFEDEVDFDTVCSLLY